MRDLADRAIEYLGDLRAVDDRCPSSCTSPQGPATRRTMRRPNGSSATRVASPRLGRLARGDVRPSTGHRHRSRGHRAHPTTAMGAGLGQLGPASACSGRALHGVLRCLPVVHRPADWPSARLYRRSGRCGRLRGDHRLGQRCELRGWQRGDDQRGPSLELRGRRCRGDVRPDRRDRRTEQP